MFTQTQYVLLLLCCFFSSFPPSFFLSVFFIVAFCRYEVKDIFPRYADVIFTSNFLHILCICAGTIIKRCCSSCNATIYGILFFYLNQTYFDKHLSTTVCIQCRTFHLKFNLSIHQIKGKINNNIFLPHRLKKTFLVEAKKNSFKYNSTTQIQ